MQSENALGASTLRGRVQGGGRVCPARVHSDSGGVAELAGVSLIKSLAPGCQLPGQVNIVITLAIQRSGQHSTLANTKPIKLYLIMWSCHRLSNETN